MTMQSFHNYAVVWRRPMGERRPEFATAPMVAMKKVGGVWCVDRDGPYHGGHRVRLGFVEVDADGCLVAPEVDR